MSATITRVGYCPFCEKEHRAHKGSLFLCYGSYRKSYYVREAARSGVEGYVPHIFILQRVMSNNTCVVSKSCAMYHCGVECRKSEKGDGMIYGIRPDAWTETVMSIRDWNALLVGMRRDPQYTL